MACEVVPIATRTGGVPEVIEHGTSGYLADVGDVDTMARYAIELLSDESALRAMGKAARAVAQARFCSSRIVPQYEAFYRAGRGALFVKARRYGTRCLQQRQPYPHQCSLPFMAIDRHPRRIAIQNLEPLGNISHADSRSSRTSGIRHLGCRHSNPVVLYLNHQTRVRQATTQVDAAAFHFRRQAVLD